MSVARTETRSVIAAVSAVRSEAKKEVEVAAVRVALEFTIFVMLALVMLEDAAVVVEKVDVAEKTAGEAVVKEPDTWRLVEVAFPRVAFTA